MKSCSHGINEAKGDQSPYRENCAFSSLSGLASLGITALTLASLTLPGCRRDPLETTRVKEKNQDGEITAVIIKGKDSSGSDFSVSIPASEYNRYRQMTVPRSIPQDNREQFCWQFVTSEDQCLKNTAAAITGGLSSKEEKAKVLLTWVSSNLKFDSEEVKSSTDYHRFPVETLFEGKGDGEDASYLYAALCRSQGIECIPVHYEGHIAAAVEGSFEGARFDFRGRQFFVADASPDPSLGDVKYRQIGVETEKFKGKSAWIYGSHLQGLATGVDGTGTQWQFHISPGAYDHYRNWRCNRGPFKEHDPGQVGFITPADPTVTEISRYLTRGCQTPEGKAVVLLDFVQRNVTYDSKERDSNKEYFRFPVETLMERTGDCEDSAFLFTSLCQAAGLDARLLRFPGHMAAAVNGDFEGTYFETDGKKFYFVECTGNSRKIGDAWDYRDKKAYVLKQPEKQPPPEPLAKSKEAEHVSQNH